MQVKDHPLYDNLDFEDKIILEFVMEEDFTRDFETQQELEDAIRIALLKGQQEY